MIQLLFRAYRVLLYPLLAALARTLFGESPCRFVPTCSRYAEEAIARRGWLLGSALALRRLLRCHPFSRGGHDPVPLRAEHPPTLPSRT